MDSSRPDDAPAESTETPVSGADQASAAAPDSKKQKLSVMWTLTSMMTAGSGLGLGLMTSSIMLVSHILNDNIGNGDHTACKVWAAGIYQNSAIEMLSGIAIVVAWWLLHEQKKAPRLVFAMFLTTLCFLFSAALVGSFFAWMHCVLVGV